MTLDGPVCLTVTSGGPVSDALGDVLLDAGEPATDVLDPDGLHRYVWTTARVVVLDEESARALRTAHHPTGRDRVVVVHVGDEPPGTIWEAAVGVGAQQVVSLPRGRDFLAGLLRHPSTHADVARDRVRAFLDAFEGGVGPMTRTEVTRYANADGEYRLTVADLRTILADGA